MSARHEFVRRNFITRFLLPSSSSLWSSQSPETFLIFLDASCPCFAQFNLRNYKWEIINRNNVKLLQILQKQIIADTLFPFFIIQIFEGCDGQLSGKQKLSIIIKITMNEFFDLVAQQLNDLTYGNGNEELNRSLKTQDDSYSLSREQSWSHFTHLTTNGNLTSSSKIKRRPLKSNSKLLNKIKEDRFCSTQIISINSQMKKVESKVLDTQLNRLQRTINCSKNPNNPRYQRQKLLIRRLNFEKQNDDKLQKQVHFDITSKFLQEIKDVNEQLYEISLNLYRFYQREKEQNDRINESTKAVKKIIQEKLEVLEQEKRKLSNIERQIKNEQKEQRKMQVKLMRNLLEKTYK